MLTPNHRTVAVILVAASFVVVSCNNAKTTPSAPPKPTPYATNSPVPSTVNSPVPSVTPTAVGDIKGESGKPQTVDIISGKPIVRSVYGDYDGERLYFCCGESRKAFEANRQVYLQKIREKGIILEKTP